MEKMYKINGNPENFADLQVFHKLAKQFIPYAQKKMGFDRPVGINLISDPENAKNPLGKTAHYDPNKLEVTVFVDKRHVKDILRSMSHELVHHTQNCRGDLENRPTGPGYAQEDGHMREMERQAYEEGQMVLRDFEDNLKKENQKMSESKEILLIKKLIKEELAEGLPALAKAVKAARGGKQGSRLQRMKAAAERARRAAMKKTGNMTPDDVMVGAGGAALGYAAGKKTDEGMIDEVSDEVKARTAPKDQANKADFLPKKVRDKINAKEGGEKEEIEEGKKCPACKKVKCEAGCNEGQVNEEKDDGSPGTTTTKKSYGPGDEPPSDDEGKSEKDKEKPEERGVTMEEEEGLGKEVGKHKGKPVRQIGSKEGPKIHPAYDTPQAKRAAQGKGKFTVKKVKKNENWTRKNKDELLFERLVKKWTK